MMLETVDLTPSIGIELRAGKMELLSGDHAAQIRRLLEERGVLCFGESHLLGLFESDPARDPAGSLAKAA